MALNTSGIQYICQNFGDGSQCCVKTGLSWYYTAGGENYNETGGTAQIVSRLASGLIDSLTMVNPARGTFTQTSLNTANGASVTLQDALVITSHDESAEDQWCFIACEAHADQNTCENLYGCYWYNGSCHTELPDCSALDNQTDCGIYGCFWYDGSCHSTMSCEAIFTQYECDGYGCYWYNGACHSALPTCSQLDNDFDCLNYDCYWYRGVCHSADQSNLCYWLDAHWPVTIANVFEFVDAYLFTTPPSGWTFVPTIQNVFGVVDYYLGFNGDAKTGCSIMS